MRKLDPATRQAVQAEINKHLADLRKVPGFVAAEPGFPLVDGRFRKEPAIIVLEKGVAVAINDAVVSRSGWLARRLADGCRRTYSKN